MNGVITYNLSRSNIEDIIIYVVSRILSNKGHLIENNRENAISQFGRYGIRLYIDNEPCNNLGLNKIFFSTKLGLQTACLIYDIRTITTVPDENAEHRYVLLSNKPQRYRNAACFDIKGPLKESIKEILKIRDVLGDYSVNGKLTSDLLSVASLNLSLNFNDKLASHLNERYFSIISNPTWKFRKQYVTGLTRGEFVEYDITEIFPFICKLVCKQIEDVIDSLCHNRETSHLPKLWNIALNCTIRRSAKAQFNNPYHINELALSYIEFILMNTSSHYQAHRIYASSRNTIVTRNFDLPLPLFNLRQTKKNIKFLFHGYIDKNIMKHCFLVNPRCNTFNGTLIVAIDGDKVHVAISYNFRPIKASEDIKVKCIRKLPSLTEQEIETVVSFIKGREIVAETLLHITALLS